MASPSAARTVLLHPFTPLREVARRVGLEPRALLKRLGWRKDRKLYELGAASASASILLPPGSYATHKLSDMLVPADVACAVAAERGFAAKIVDPEPPQEALGSGGAPVASDTAVVAVLAHVDHGKTTFLDALSGNDEVAREPGGITQSVRPALVPVPPALAAAAPLLAAAPRFFAFVDTPGHRVFDGMRAAASDGADAALVLVAADAGVQPQTTEVVRRCVRRGQRLVLAISKADLLADSVEDAAATAGARRLAADLRALHAAEIAAARAEGGATAAAAAAAAARAARRSSCCVRRAAGASSRCWNACCAS